MKKILSTVLAGTILISSIGAVATFAVEPEMTVSVAAEPLAENEAVPQMSFWQSHKKKLLKIAGGAVAVVTLGAITYLGYILGQVPNDYDPSKSECTNERLKEIAASFPIRLESRNNDTAMALLRRAFAATEGKSQEELNIITNKNCDIYSQMMKICKSRLDAVYSNESYIERVFYKVQLYIANQICSTTKTK